MDSPALSALLGHQASSPSLLSFLSSLEEVSSSSPALPPAAPEVKAYSDAVYYNYHAFGLSLLFVPVGGFKPQGGVARREDLPEERLILDSIDVYNVAPGTGKDVSDTAYAQYPAFPISIPLVTLPTSAARTKTHIDIGPETIGQDFVRAMGEPTRKGGGSGPSAGSIGIWCEWTQDGVMVEFGGDESRGAQAWETGKNAAWRVLTVFNPETKVSAVLS